MTPDQIKPDTALFGLMGDALEKTPLPNMLNAFFDYNGLNAFCSIFNIRQDDIPFFLTNLKTRPIAGIFVQPSHMEPALAYIDRFSGVGESARAIDSAVIQEGELIGYNFKAEGIVRELEEGGLEGKTVAVMGTSPLALAAALAVAEKAPAKMILVDAAPEAALAMGETIKGHCGFESFSIDRCAEGVTTDLASCDAVLNYLAIDKDARFTDLKTDARVYDADGSFTGASWQKGVHYQGPYYLTMLQIQGMSDTVLGGSSRIDPGYMESAEVIEVF